MTLIKNRPVGYSGRSGGGGGGVAWGAITGSLSAQADLVAALAAKQKYANDGYIVVQTSADPVANGLALIAAYQAATELSPNGLPIGETNHAVVILPPGRYEFVYDPIEDEWPSLGLSQNYIDVVGLTDIPADVLITSAKTTQNSGTVVAVCNYADVRGVTIENTGATRVANDQTDASALCTGVSQDGVTYTNCAFKDGSGTSWCMRQGLRIASTFINCTADDYACGSHGGVFGGTARNCQVGSNSFGSGAGGNFEGECFDCKAGSNSFGGGTGLAVECSGNLYRCVAGGGSSFGVQTFSGYAEDCSVTGSGGDSFGGIAGVCSGTVKNCSSGTKSFGGDINGLFSGIAIGCTAGTFSFGDTFSGYAVDCEGGNNCFGFGPPTGPSSGQFTGRCVDCRSGSTSFGNGAMNGVCIDCKGGNNSFAGNNFSSLGGLCQGCSGGEGSFTGNYGSLLSTGVIKDCILSKSADMHPDWVNEWNCGYLGGRVSGVRFQPTGSNKHAVIIAGFSDGEMENCTFKKTGTGTPMALELDADPITIKFSYCKFNTASPIGAGITNAFGTLAQAFCIANTAV